MTPTTIKLTVLSSEVKYGCPLLAVDLYEWKCLLALYDLFSYTPYSLNTNNKLLSCNNNGSAQV